MITNSKLIHHPALPSTNDECKRLAAAGEPEGTAVWGDAQTAGRGRSYHDWVSEAGGLYCSLLLRPTAITSVQVLSLVAGVALAEAMAELTGLNVQLKWPNDLILGRKKLGGILCEVAWLGQRPEYAVVGIGVNVNQRSFPPHLEGSATSLVRETGQKYDIGRLLQFFLAQFDTEYQAGSLRHPRAELLQNYRLRLSTLGQSVRIDTGTRVVEGRAADIDEAGHLILETERGRLVVATGTVLQKD